VGWFQRGWARVRRRGTGPGNLSQKTLQARRIFSLAWHNKFAGSSTNNKAPTIDCPQLRKGHCQKTNLLKGT